MGDPGGATEPARVDFGRSSWSIEPLRAAKVARGGRSRRPRSRSGSILARSGSILARKSCSKRLHRQGRRRSHFEADFWWLFRRFCTLLPRSRFLANIAGTLRFVVRDVQSQCSSRLLSMRVSHDDRARIASRFGYQNLTKIVPKTAWNELPERNWPPKRFGGAFGSILAPSGRLRGLPGDLFDPLGALGGSLGAPGGLPERSRPLPARFRGRSLARLEAPWPP